MGVLEVVFLALASTCGVYSQELRGGVTGTKVQTGKIAPVEVAGGFFPSSASPDDEENDYDLEGERPGRGNTCWVKKGESAKKKCKGKNKYCKTDGCPTKARAAKGRCASLKCRMMSKKAEVCGCDGKIYGSPIAACGNAVSVAPNFRRCRRSEEGADGEWDGAEDAEWDEEGEDDGEDTDAGEDEDDSEDENYERDEDDDEDDEDEGGQSIINEK